MLSQAFAVSGVRLFDGKSGTGGLWMTNVVPLDKNGVIPCRN